MRKHKFKLFVTTGLYITWRCVHCRRFYQLARPGWKVLSTGVSLSLLYVGECDHA